MGVVSRTKKTIQEAYQSMKKSFNSFFKKLGFNKKESYEVSNSFDQQLKKILSEYDKEHQKLKEVLDKIIPENEPVTALENEVLDSLSPETRQFLTPSDEKPDNSNINSLINGLVSSLQNGWDEFSDGTLSLLKQYLYIPENLKSNEIIPYLEEMGYPIANEPIANSLQKETNNHIRIPPGTYIIDASKIIQIDLTGEEEPTARLNTNTNWILTIDNASYLGDKITDNDFLGNTATFLDEAIPEQNDPFAKKTAFNLFGDLLGSKIFNQKLDAFRKNNSKKEPEKSLHSEILDSLSPEIAEFLVQNKTLNNTIPAGSYVANASKMVQFDPINNKSSQTLNKNALLYLSLDKAIYAGNKDIKNILNQTMAVAENTNQKNNSFSSNVFFSNLNNILGIKINPIPKISREKKNHTEELLELKKQLNSLNQDKEFENER